MTLSAAERESLIERYANGPAVLKAALAKIPAAALQWRPGPGKWSAHEIIVHCADSESNSHGRIRHLLAEATPVIQGYDQDRWAAGLRYGAGDLKSLLSELAAFRSRTLRLLRDLTPAELERVGQHSERGPESVGHMMKLMAAHDLVHRRQIARIRGAFGKPA